MTDPLKLEQRLKTVNESIASHPLSSAPVREAFEVIERYGKTNVDAISDELRRRDLPSLEELGKVQARHTFSWWRLNRRRRSLEKRLSGSQSDAG